MKHFVLFLVAIATLCGPVAAQTRVKNLYASLAPLDLTQLKNTNQAVQLNRYLFAGYNTLCLPMSASAEQLKAAAQDVRLERLVGIGQEGNKLNLYFLDCTEEGIEAGEPYLVFSPKAQYLRLRNTEAKVVAENLNTVRMTDNAGNTVTFGSSWETLHKEGYYGIPALQDTELLESVLIRTDAEKAFLPTRCGFNWEEQSASATELCIKHIQSLSETTNVKVLPKANEIVDVYDLKGNLVKKQVKRSEALQLLQRGVYVIGGDVIAK